MGLHGDGSLGLSPGLGVGAAAVVATAGMFGLYWWAIRSFREGSNVKPAAALTVGPLLVGAIAGALGLAASQA